MNAVSGGDDNGDHLQLAPRGYDLGYYMMFAVRWWLGERMRAARRRN